MLPCYDIRDLREPVLGVMGTYLHQACLVPIHSSALLGVSSTTVAPTGFPEAFFLH